MAESVEKRVKKYVVGRLESLIEMVGKVEFAGVRVGKEGLYTEAQTNILLMIFAFKTL